MSRFCFSKAQKEKSEDKRKRGFARFHPDTVDVYVGRLIDAQVHIYVDDLFEWLWMTLLFIESILCERRTF